MFFIGFCFLQVRLALLARIRPASLSSLTSAPFFQVLCMEYLGSGSSILAITVFAKEDKDTKPRNEALQEKKQAARRGELEQDLSCVPSFHIPFSSPSKANPRLSFHSVDLPLPRNPSPGLLVRLLSFPSSSRLFVLTTLLFCSPVDYTVPVPGGHRKLLNDIYGYCKPGTLTALMGASGAGKSASG